MRGSHWYVFQLPIASLRSEDTGNPGLGRLTANQTRISSGTPDRESQVVNRKSSITTDESRVANPESHMHLCVVDWGTVNVFGRFGMNMDGQDEQVNSGTDACWLRRRRRISVLVRPRKASRCSLASHPVHPCHNRSQLPLDWSERVLEATGRSANCRMQAFGRKTLATLAWDG